MKVDEDALLQAHLDEARSKGAEFYNLGWSTTDTGIASKTSLGILDSEVDEQGKVTHQWVQRRR